MWHIAVTSALRRMMTPTALFALFLIFVACKTDTGWAAVSVNLPLQDEAYPLLEKLAGTHFTFRNAITLKPITRLAAAQFIAEAIRHRRDEWETIKSQEPFLDQTLQYLANRFKPELREIGAFYQPRKPRPFIWKPIEEATLDLIASYDPFIRYDPYGLSSQLPDMLSPDAALSNGEDIRLRLRAASWGTLWQHVAGYIEPAVVFRSNSDDGQSVDASLYKAYLKISYVNLDLTVGREILQWGPGFEDDILLSRYHTPLDLISLSTPLPFRLPGHLQSLGTWQVSVFAARLDTDFTPAPSLLSGLRATWQPASFVQFGYTSLVQDDGDDSDIAVQDLLSRLLWAESSNDDDHLQSQAAYDIVVSLPFFRRHRFINGIRLYWQYSPDEVKKNWRLFNGRNLIGGVIDGKRWDVRFEFTETRDQYAVWYTNTTYRSGTIFRPASLGEPIGMTVERYMGRAAYYLAPTTWFAADGRYERYGIELDNDVATMQRFGVEASHQLPAGKRRLQLWGRFEYTVLSPSFDATQHGFAVHLLARWRL